jgi:Uma2 family endonuclease
MDTGTSDEPPVRRFTADEAMRMVEAGIVGEDEHVELLDGAFVEMGPQGVPHSRALLLLGERLRVAFHDRAHVREQQPLVASTFNLPEPDIAVIRGQITDYPEHPTGHDAVLAVEIAWSSHRIDRQKASTYAEAGVAVPESDVRWTVRALLP